MEIGPENAAPEIDDELASLPAPVDSAEADPGTGSARSMVDMIASLRSFETGP